MSTERLPKANRVDGGFIAPELQDDSQFGEYSATGAMRTVRASVLESYVPKCADKGFIAEVAEAIHNGQLKTALTMARTFEGRTYNRGLQEGVVSTDLDVLFDGSIRTHVVNSWKEIDWAFLDVLRVTNYPDYETQKLVMPSEIDVDDQTSNNPSSGTFPKVPEHRGFMEAEMTEKYETLQIDDYGAVFSVSARALAKDDKNVLPRLPQFLGRCARRTVSALVANLFEQASGAGPTMTEDSAVAFSTGRGNLASAALTIANAETGWAAMAGMTAYAGGSTGRIMGLTPSFLVVPAALELTATKLFAGDAGVLLYGADDETYISNKNALAGRLQVRVWKDLTDTNSWMLLTAPADFPTGEIAFLNGVQEPIIEVQGGIGPDLANPLGRKYRVRTAVGVGLVDWRGVYRSNGAT